jgi:outer membrane protein assembly factor BamB
LWVFEGGADYNISSSVSAVNKGIVYLVGYGRSQNRYNSYIHAVNVNTGEEMWKREIEGGASEIAISNDTLYFYNGGSRDSPGYRYALNAISGIEIWKHEITVSDYESVAIGSEKIFMATYSVDLYAFDRKTGEELWNFNTEIGVLASYPKVSNNMVFIGDSSNLYALDVNTGQEKWRVNGGGFYNSEIIVLNNVIIHKDFGHIRIFK